MLIGLYGGTFDPVHLGHVHVAETILATTPLAEIRWVLSARPGHRAEPSATIEHRWQMLQLVCQQHDQFSADDTEIGLAGPSYTYRTVETIARATGGFPCWIMGYDAFATLESWHQWQLLMQACNFILVQRPGMPSSLSPALEKLLELHGVTQLEQRIGQILVVDVAMLDVSSTQVRALIAANKEAQDLLAPPVYTYINDHQLYTENVV